VSCERDITLEPWKSVRNPPPEEEGVEEKMYDEPSAIPIRSPPVSLGAGRGREMGVKLSLGRREGWGEGVLRSDLISYYPTLI